MKRSNILKQTVVKSLVVEAARKNCSQNRRKAILEKLSNSTASAESPTSNSRRCYEEGISHVMTNLFTKTCEKDPGMLLGLIPAFLMLCGKREGNDLICEIDWDIVTSKK